MCGRYTHQYTWAQVHSFLQGVLPGVIEAPEAELPPNYNLAPTQSAYVLCASQTAAARCKLARWGFAPAWATSGPRPINARSESVATSGLFRQAFKSSRVVVPASGWFEWRAESSGKQPYYFHLPDDQPLWMAGILTRNADNEPNFAILTGAPVPACTIHDRSPILLDPDQLADWINPQLSMADVTALARPGSATAQAVQLRKVSKAVNNTRNQGPELLNELPADCS